MQQMTAIDWFYQQTVIEGKKNYWELLEQAKQMEKEQIKDAYYYDPNTDDVKDDGEQYYNETFNNK